jgi:hypothetical protein
LGRVRDGVAQPGSVREHDEYDLTPDGVPRQVRGSQTPSRTVTASWAGDTLLVEAVWHLSRGGEGIEVSVNETWRLIDDGDALEILRETRWPDGSASHDSIVFDRQR